MGQTLVHGNVDDDDDDDSASSLGFMGAYYGAHLSTNPIPSDTIGDI